VNVFDSSAVLAVIFGEPGADVAEALMHDDDAVVSSVTHAETLAKLLDKGMTTAQAAKIFQGLQLTVLPFTLEQAEIAGRLRPSTRPLGLSLGDRCCLALARSQNNATVVTADRPWAHLTDFSVTLIR
jgi:ribonuclease VapC